MNDEDIEMMMRALLEVEKEPKVGFFWHLPEENDLFGANSISILNSQKSEDTVTRMP